MKNFKNLEDLLAEETFFLWLNGQTKGEDKIYWDNWYLESPHNAQLVEQAKLFFSGLKNSPYSILAAEIDKEADRILKSIERNEKSWFFIHRLKIAASLLLLLSFTILFTKFKPSISPSAPIVHAQNVLVSSLFNDSLIRFSCGSTALLRKGSTIRFDQNFSNKTRSVYLLEGEAFFEVTKNKNLPFIVFANDIVTKVLGTSFTVTTNSTNEGAISSVVVKTGVVVVFKKSDFVKSENSFRDSIFLLPNQKVSQKVTITPLVPSLVEVPVLLEEPIENPNFVFDNEPISAVFNTLEKAYGVQVECEEVILKNCRLTISLGSQDELFEKIKVICKVIGASYEVIDTKIKISGKGCIPLNPSVKPNSVKNHY